MKLTVHNDLIKKLASRISCSLRNHTTPGMKWYDCKIVETSLNVGLLTPEIRYMMLLFLVGEEQN